MEEDDPFASLIPFCAPTASQEEILRNCTMAGQSHCFTDSDPDKSSSSSSAEPTPAEPTEIFMISPPGSPDSVQQHVEDESVFHTPPEHHPPSHLSSSEDQNVDEGVDNRRKNVRASEAGMGDEPEAKKSRSMEDEDTVPVGETEVIVDDTENIVNLGDDDNDIKTNGKRIEEIDEFRYDRRRQLPVSLKEKEKEQGLLDFLDLLKVIVRNTEVASDDDEDEDFFAMIQRKGFAFPKPRWW